MVSNSAASSCICTDLENWDTLMIVLGDTYSSNIVTLRYGIHNDYITENTVVLVFYYKHSYVA